jgi:pimeloyl-ACP methyl ester carboxylesterase
MRQIEFQATGVVLSFVEGSASSPPVLLLHGLFDGWEILRPIASLLSGCWHAHSFDMRRHGKSRRVTGGLPT